jgi:hypothetical protein
MTSPYSCLSGRSGKQRLIVSAFAAHALKPLMRHQITPETGLQLGHGHTSDADALHGQHRKACGLATVCDLSGYDTLEGEAQPCLVLPADLYRREGAAIELDAVVEQLEFIRGKRTRHFHDVFLLNGCGFICQFARYPEVLGKYSQAAGISLQGRAWRQSEKVLAEEVDAGMIFRRVRVGAEMSGAGIHVSGLVKQNGHRLNRGEIGLGVKFDYLFRYHELRLFHHLPINRYPAACDIKLCLAARAADEFDKAFCETDGFGHESAF